MKSYLVFVKENMRFSLAIFANSIALLAAFWWLIISNFNTSQPIEMEPIVTCLALTATLLGLNFVNDKLTRPFIKVSLSTSMTEHPINGFMYGISVNLENHSMLKAFIKNFQVELPKTKQVMQFLNEGFTEQPLPKVILEPGQAYSFNIVRKNVDIPNLDISSFGDFVVTTDVGYKFIVPAKEFQDRLRVLLDK
jgi:hypothetical protein